MYLLREHARPVRLRGAPLEQLARPVEVGHRPGDGDVMLGDPEGGDEPGVARHVRDVLRLLEVVVVLVSREATDRGLHPEPVFEGSHRRHHPRIVRRQHAEEEDAGDRHVQRRVLRDRAVGLHRDRAHESPPRSVVQVRERGALDLVRRGAVAPRQVVLAERRREVPRR